jgi:hypothetical protein
MKRAAEVILNEAGGPLKPDQIAERALKRKLITTKGKTPEATMAARLSVASKAGDTFVRVAPNTYGLKGRDRQARAD